MSKYFIFFYSSKKKKNRLVPDSIKLYISGITGTNQILFYESFSRRIYRAYTRCVRMHLYYDGIHKTVE